MLPPPLFILSIRDHWPAGFYLVAAVAGIDRTNLYDLAVFQEIAASGSETLVEAGETTMLDIVLTLERNQRGN